MVEGSPSAAPESVSESEGNIHRLSLHQSESQGIWAAPGPGPGVGNPCCRTIGSCAFSCIFSWNNSNQKRCEFKQRNEFELWTLLHKSSCRNRCWLVPPQTGPMNGLKTSVTRHVKCLQLKCYRSLMELSHGFLKQTSYHWYWIK